MIPERAKKEWSEFLQWKTKEYEKRWLFLESPIFWLFVCFSENRS